MSESAVFETRTAESRTRRVLGVALGVAALFYAINGYGTATAQLALMPPVAVVLYLVVSIAPIAVGLASVWAPDWGIRALGSVHCLVYAVSLVSFVPLLGTSSLPLSTTPWTYEVTVVATAASALCWPARAAWSYAVLISAAAGVVRYATLPGEDLTRGFQDGAIILAVAAIFVALPQLALRAGQELDAAGARAREEATNDARVRAVQSERIRLDALMHDHVLALLLAAGRSGDQPAERAELQARAQRVVELLPAPDSATLDSHMTATDFLQRLHESTPTAFEWREAVLPEQDLASVRLPQSAAHALLGAAAEAVTNSVRHAGPAQRSIEVHITAPTRVDVVVADDGRGFSRDAVPAERLGVQLSMEARVNSVGGSADLQSRPGEGTTVRLAWPALHETGRMRTRAVAKDPSEVSTPTDISSALRLGAWPAWLLMAAFTVANALNTLSTLSEVYWPPYAILTLLAVTTGAFLLCQPAPDPYVRLPSILVVLLVIGVSFAAWNVPPGHLGTPTSWFLLSSAILLFFLAVRGRIVLAWFGFAVHMVIVTWAALAAGFTPTAALSFTIPHAVPILAASVFVPLLRSTLAQVRQLQEEARTHAAAQEGARAGLAEQERRMRRLWDISEEALTHLASPAPLTPADRHDFLLTEAAVRDWLRGGPLATPEVLAAARTARERGVRISLLDDSHGSASPQILARVTGEAVAALAEANSGDAVIRLLPAGRSLAATVHTGARTLIIPAIDTSISADVGDSTA
ncbi:sensor histidine kinase [Bogoriella caseilytica]|uniref:Signal transduction histidine kinase n=1 Tax=Bogoriella caseilytica TaxID=56055 RepID=A0A3N2BG01_9MICO|nr:sensor histidine kinase [Bogoriella caseilytica]ROR74177.1 signal transduction histidine kinase [Bogoriella caseilytica]